MITCGSISESTSQRAVRCSVDIRAGQNTLRSKFSSCDAVLVSERMLRLRRLSCTVFLQALRNLLPSDRWDSRKSVFIVLCKTAGQRMQWLPVNRPTAMGHPLNTRRGASALPQPNTPDIRRGAGCMHAQPTRLARYRCDIMQLQLRGWRSQSDTSRPSSNRLCRDLCRMHVPSQRTTEHVAFSTLR